MQESEDILGSCTKIAILRYLTTMRTGLSGNEIATRLGLRQSTVHPARESLVTAGIVTRADVGRSASYAIDDDLSFTRSILLPLFEAEANLRNSVIKDLIQECKKLAPKPSAVILFGSLARGGRSYRDADLLCIVSEQRGKYEPHDTVVDRFKKIRRKYKLPVSTVILTETSLRFKESAAIVSEVRRDGILLFGASAHTFKNLKHYDA